MGPTLCHGSESRQMLETHVKGHYDELALLVRNGITLQVDGKNERFNIVAFLVADLSFVKEVLGRRSSSHTYGCFHCNFKIQSWASIKKKIVRNKLLK